jgi:hypothetical protein
MLRMNFDTSTLLLFEVVDVQCSMFNVQYLVQQGRVQDSSQALRKS